MKLRAAQAILRIFAATENLADVPEPKGIERAIEQYTRRQVLATLPDGLELPSPQD